MDAKRQSMIMIGVALIVISGVVFYMTSGDDRVQVPPATTVVSADANASNTTTEQNEDVSVSLPVNLNDATVEDLMAIDGIGEANANKIIEYRSVIGKYTSVEQIKDIYGVGDSTYSNIAPYVFV